MALQIISTDSAVAFSFSSYDATDFREYAGWCEMTGVGIVEHAYTDAGGIIHYVAVGRTIRRTIALMKLRWGNYQQNHK